MRTFSIPSDDLARLREYIVQIPSLREGVGLPLQLWLVLDTNIVLADLLWLAGKRKDVSARTDLQEIIDSGTVIALVPDWLRDEVEEHLPDLAVKRMIPEDRLWQTWQEYQKYLRFCSGELGEAVTDHQVVDLNDLPFIWLFVQSGARAIVSRDWHIAAMSAGRIGPEIMRPLREYARAESWIITIKLAGHAGVVVLGGSAILTGQMAIALVRRFVQLPTWGQLALLIGVGMMALHPRGREAIKTTSHKALSAYNILAMRLEPPLTELIETFTMERARASHALRTVEQMLPASRKISLETAAFSVCLAAGTPLSLQEIKERVLLRGYQSQSRSFESYLRRVIRQSPRFVYGPDGRWSATRHTNLTLSVG